LITRPGARRWVRSCLAPAPPGRSASGCGAGREHPDERRAAADHLFDVSSETVRDFVLYNLDELGWYQFEQLCQALLRAAHGAELEAWGGSHDTGKDAYAEGTLRYPDGRIEQQGPFIFQVKFVSNANAIGSNPRAALLAAINRESARIAQRLDDGSGTNLNTSPS
jgi:hypothetical protein